MGEIERMIMVKLKKKGILFGGKGYEIIFERGNLLNKYV